MKKRFVLGMAILLAANMCSAVDFDTSACVTPKSHIFVSGLQRYVYMKDGANNRWAQTNYQPTAVAVGYEWTMSDRWSVGLSGSFEQGNVQHYGYGPIGYDYMKTRERTWGVTLFGGYKGDAGFYAKGSGFLGCTYEKLKQGYLDPFALSAGDSDSSRRWAASIEFGKVFENCAGFAITPHVGFDYSYVPATELNVVVPGVGPSQLPSLSQNFYEVPVGVTFAKNFLVGCDWVLTPSLDLTFISSIGNMKDSNHNGRPGFASRTGSEWKVYGIGAGHWGGRVTAGFKAVKMERFDVDVNYGFEGRKDYHDHRITASIGFKF